MDNQTFFNQAVQHILEQGGPAKQATYPFSCKYRLDDRACIVGKFIPDEEYDEEFEGMDVHSLLNNAVSPPPSIIKLAEEVDVNLMSSMQSAHDGAIAFFFTPEVLVEFEDNDDYKEDHNDAKWLYIFRKRATQVGLRFGLDVSCLS